MAELSMPGDLGAIAQAALDAIEESADTRGINVKRCFILVYSDEVVPNTGVAAAAEGDEDAEVHGHLLDMLCSAARQCAERAGIPFAIATVPADASQN